MNSNWFIKFRENNPTSTRIYMLPFAGGNAGMFANWADEFPDLAVVGVQYPGRGSRFMEPCVDDAQTMADQLAQSIENEPDHYFFIFGYSMGAILAFETLVALKPSIRQLCLGLFVAARAAPGYEHHIEPLNTLDNEHFIKKLRSMGGAPDEVLADKDLMEVLMPMLRADFRLSERYQLIHNTVLPISITALYGDNDPYANYEATKGWSRHSSREYKHIKFVGGHFFINDSGDLLKSVVRETIDATI